MKRSQRTGLSNLCAALIEMIASYLTEDEKQSACIAFDVFFQCTTSVVCHIDTISSTRRKRKRAALTESFETYRQKTWQLMQNPKSAGQLRRITLLLPVDYGDFGSDLPMPRLYDIRNYDNSALIEKDSHIDRVLDVIRKNMPELRFFEMNLCRSLKPLLPALVRLIELKLPSTTSLQEISLPSLRMLTIVHTSKTECPATLPIIPSLRNLEIQLRFFISPFASFNFVDLEGLPRLRDLLLTATHTGRHIGLASYQDPRVFRGYSSSIRHVSVHGPFVFSNFWNLKVWLQRLSAKHIRSLCFDGVNFDYDPVTESSTSDPDLWYPMPRLYSLQIEKMNPTFIQALPCYNLRKLFVVSGYGTRGENDDALSNILETAVSSIEMVSITSQKFVPHEDEALWEHHLFSTSFVNSLARCLRLRHFESLGPHFYTLTDWQFLCTRVFPHMDQVHVEAQHPRLYDRPDSLDIRCREHQADAICLAGLLELYDGRMYVSPTLSDRWIQKQDESTAVVRSDTEIDPGERLTQYLRQQFLQQADKEGDFSDVHDHRHFQSPRLTEAAWCEYPAFVCKRLRCLPEEWNLDAIISQI